jgi:hypothetical protein
MRKVLITTCLAIVFLSTSLAISVLQSPNLDMSQKSSFADLGSIAYSTVPSIDVEEINIEQAASGNSKPVNITANVTQFSSSSKTIESICGLGMSNFEIDSIEMPSGGKAARIMSVSPRHANFMYATAPCSYLISIIPITDYLNQGSPYKPSPAKQNTWVNGVYTLRLRYMNGGSEIASTTFSFTIGGDTSWIKDSQFNRVTDTNYLA